MGNNSSIVNAERKTWLQHDLQFNHPVRAANLKTLSNIEDGTNVRLTYSNRDFYGIKYQHWFLTVGDYYIEFGSHTSDIYTACVTISTCSNRVNEGTVFEKVMDSETRERIGHVLGMSNYSLCLRNCEHVANYIIRNRWVSIQMNKRIDKETLKEYGYRKTNSLLEKFGMAKQTHIVQAAGIIMDYFQSYMLGDTMSLVNSFPACIQPHVFSGSKEKKTYSFINDQFRASQFSYYLDSNADTYNILVVGPTGAGKSHLINVIFNDTICEAKTSHHSVTREVYFIRGQGDIYNINNAQFQRKNIIVADTIGLCDTEWNDDQIINLIKGRVSSNIRFVDAVFIVFRADRLSPQHVKNIQRILAWVEHTKYPSRIKLVSTFADYLTKEKKTELRKQVTKIFNITNGGGLSPSSSIIYAGFPPEDALNDMTKQRLIECWKELKTLLTMPGNSDRISLDSNRPFRCQIL